MSFTEEFLKESIEVLKQIDPSAVEATRIGTWLRFASGVVASSCWVWVDQPVMRLMP